MTRKEETQMWGLFEKCIREGLRADAHFYKVVDDRENGAWHGMVVAFRCGRELAAGCEYIAATMAENVPWQILKRAAELGNAISTEGGAWQSEKRQSLRGRS